MRGVTDCYSNLIDTDYCTMCEKTSLRMNFDEN